MKFPKVIATSPPKPLSKNAILLGRISAVLMIFLVLVQLAGIVKMTESLSSQFYDQNGWAIAVAGLVLLTEIFSIPFLLRFKLSDLARLFSGVCSIVAPWIWVVITVWSIGEDVPASQFGILAGFNIDWWLLAFNFLWLSFNFYVIWKLGLEKTWRKIIDTALDLKKTKK